MKVTADPLDPDCWSNKFKTAPTVTLNDEPIRDVVEADDVEGYAIVCCRTPSGRLAVSHGEKIIARLNGKIAFVGADPIIHS